MSISFNSLNLKALKKVKLIYSDGTYSIKRLHICDSFFSRLRGMLFSRRPVLKDAYLIIPCNAVHSFFMAYPIDIIFLSKYGEVISLLNLKPFKTAYEWGSFAVLEGAKLLKSNNNVVQVLFLC